LRWLTLYSELGVDGIRIPEAPPAPPESSGEAPLAPAPTSAAEPDRVLGPPASLMEDALADHQRMRDLIHLGDPPRALRALRDDVIGDCRRCGLCHGRNKIVFGVGNPAARLMFVGEGPGVDEDRKGEPFVGRAGQLLDRILAAMGLDRSQVYIGNVVKCRPPDNRVPTPDEAATCVPFLRAQIAIIRPEVIVALGRTALEGLLGQKVASMSRVRGDWMSFEGIPLMPTFHPAYLLRSPQAKRPVWEDMKTVLAKLDLPVP
jgi:DNA polymerase